MTKEVETIQIVLSFTVDKEFETYFWDKLEYFTDEYWIEECEPVEAQ